MADLFSMTAPLMIRFPNGESKIMIERFPHPRGLLFFEAFWHVGDPQETVHVVDGPIKGDGPWKVGDCVVHVLGCQGVDQCLAMEYESWQAYLAENEDEYPQRQVVLAIARARGATVNEPKEARRN